MASRYCVFCNNWDREHPDKDKDCQCALSKLKTSALVTCPGWKPIERSAEEQARLDKEKEELLSTSNTIKREIPISKVEKKISSMSEAQVKKIGKQVHKEAIQMLEREEKVQIKLFDHQIKAREKFKDIDDIALFFEMGCGKTLTSMMIICDKFNAGKIDSLLVVAPNDVHKQWFDDLCNEDSVLSRAIEQEHVQCIGQIVGGRGGAKDFYEFEDDGKLHIVCVNIDTFSTPHKWEPIVEWANHNKTAIIVDEATIIKNPTSKRAQRMLYEFNHVMTRGRTILYSDKINPVRIVLTGTPVTNGPMDLWAIMEFVKPNYFNRNYYSFMNYYGMHTKLNVESRVIQVLLTEKTWHGIHNCNDYQEAFCLFGCSEDTYMTIKHQDHYMGPYKHADELKQLLEPNAVFAKLVDCVDMPACNYVVKNVAMSPSQEAAYNSMKNELLAQFDNYVATAKNKLVSSIRLQQIASGFIMAHEQPEPADDVPFWSEPDENYDVAPEEVVWLGDTNPKLEQLMRDIDETDKPVIIFTRFSAEAAKIYDMLKDKYSTCLITGWKTVGSIEGFKDREFDVMVANTTKLARGFNLQVAHTTIYYSNTFSMELRQQSEFRTFRMGQKHPCTYIDYVSCDIDRTINEALSLKKNLLDYIREKDIKEIL